MIKTVCHVEVSYNRPFFYKCLYGYFEIFRNYSDSRLVGIIDQSGGTVGNLFDIFYTSIVNINLSG